MIPGLEIPPQYGYPLVTAIILAAIGYIIQRALKNRPGPPTIPEMWARIEVLEAKADASTAREATAMNDARSARTETEALKAETSELKTFIADWITRLVKWDIAGRKGRMPIPADDDLTRLNIRTD